MFIADFEELFALGKLELVRRQIATAVSTESQRTIVHNEMPGEESFRRTKPVGEQLPQTAATHLGTHAVESEHRTFWMFQFRASDGSPDFHPVANGGNLAKWNPRLCHPEGPGIHAQKDDSLFPAAKPAQIKFMGRPCIIQRVVDVADR